jgi:hypothetical protein
MSLQQQSDVSKDVLFQGRVTMSTYRAANSIVGEDWQTLGYTEAKANKRHDLGVLVLSGSKSALTSFFNSVAADVGDVTDQSLIADATIDTSVDSVWDDIAGVTYAENQ